MRQVYDKINFLLGTAEILEKMPEQRALAPFDNRTLEFLNELSVKIREIEDIRLFPDMAAFGFWCRSASLSKMKASYGSGIRNRLGRGVSLHFAPSNIPMLFAFSMAAGLLSGNGCAVRLPSRETVQAEKLCDIMKKMLDGEYSDFKNRIAIFRYEHDREITDALSKLCDVRVMWGGDSSVSEIRKSPISPRAVELPFADRSSIAVIEANAVINSEDIQPMVHGFYNDTYLNDQNACSSPRIIYWLGNNGDVKAARERFWQTVFNEVKGKYDIQAVTAVSKLTAAMALAAKYGSARIEKNENYITRIWLDELSREIWDDTVPGGFFVESGGEKLDGILPILTKHCQTVCYFGDIKAKTAEFIEENRTFGADRIVPFGHALDFELTWDGHDLIYSMSRKITML